MNDQTILHPGEMLELVINRKDDVPYTPRYITRPQGTVVRASILTNDSVEGSDLIGDLLDKL